MQTDNKKWGQFLLIALVVVIWGYVFYYVFEKIQPPEQVKIGHNQSTQVESDTIQYHLVLSLNYPDPFLKYIPKSAVNEYFQPELIETKKNAPIPLNGTKNETRSAGINFPSLNYYGAIKVNNKANVAFIKFNNQLLYLNKHEIHQNLKINEIYEDSICCEYLNETKTIYKYSTSNSSAF